MCGLLFVLTLSLEIKVFVFLLYLQFCFTCISQALLKLLVLAVIVIRRFKIKASSRNLMQYESFIDLFVL